MKTFSTYLHYGVEAFRICMIIRTTGTNIIKFHVSSNSNVIIRHSKMDCQSACNNCVIIMCTAFYLSRHTFSRAFSDAKKYCLLTPLIYCKMIATLSMFIVDIKLRNHMLFHNTICMSNT